MKSWTRIFALAMLATTVAGAQRPLPDLPPTDLPSAQRPGEVSRVWAPDLGDGRYKNPVLYADYSDPDVIRVGDDFYLVSSSFNMVPALPILHSRDLVNWEIVAHVFTQQQPADRYKTPQHGNGVWAPSIRFHDGEFYIYYPDPDVGIFMTKAKAVSGPWSTPLLVKDAPGWIDPCPFWDGDGKAYLVNASAGSRRGVKGILMVSRMSPDGTRLLDDASIVVDGHGQDPTLEGPKMYKREGWYYLFAPAGGVSTGWQVVFRSKNIYGPYERRVVLAQGATRVNGPHQGAWVDTASGENWFLHFQDQGAYGRVVWLEPMQWKDGWPQIGVNASAGGPGEPALTYRKPKVARPVGAMTPADADEFNASQIGPQWQWQANPEPNWAFPSAALGVLRLIAVPAANGDRNLWNVPHVLTQKLPGQVFAATTKLTFMSSIPGEETGLVILGMSYAGIVVRNEGQGLSVRVVERKDAAGGGAETSSELHSVAGHTLYLRATMATGAKVQFSYSVDGIRFDNVGRTFAAVQGRWVGATLGIYALGMASKGEVGYADFDWLRFNP